jgi:hypothetical protein
MIRPLTTVSSKRYRNLCDLSRGLMQILIRHLYRAAPETVQRATHAFSAPTENMGIDHRGFDIVSVQEFLYGSDIITVLHQGVKQERTKYDVAVSEVS